MPTPNCERAQGAGWESNPRRRITGAVSSPLDDRCNKVGVGPEGLEPSLARLRAGCAAANTLVPSIDHHAFARVGPGGDEPPPSGYRPLVLPLNHGLWSPWEAHLS